MKNFTIIWPILYDSEVSVAFIGGFVEFDEIRGGFFVVDYQIVSFMVQEDCRRYKRDSIFEVIKTLAVHLPECFVNNNELIGSIIIELRFSGVREQTPNLF